MTEKVALVTGAANGIGKATAKRLARDGIAIGVLDLLEDGAAAVAGEIEQSGGKAIALAADVSDRESVQAALARLRDAFGPVTIVVNNAGITGFVPFLELTDEDWDRMLAVNLKSAFIVTQEIIPDMIAAGWGRIVNISSSSAQSGAVKMAHYSSSKGGMIALTRTLAQEFGEHNITCNAVPPRFVHNTAMSNESFEREDMKERFQAMVDAGPIRRHGEPEDIAGAVAWLVSDEAGYVTGQVIGVNGGRYI
ncbi:MAG: SDR family oxidoreductase [Novosphingobium sp.]|nr:SDR family oxidoreductase [Novosphingobium sp.]MCP5404086.1 SDR family oxidoreductase [Novosphingobium sp.]